MKNYDITLGKAALIAGIGLLIMVVAAPISELYINPKIIFPDNPSETIQNITSKNGLFICAIFGYLITFILDIVVAWALYLFLSPVSKQLSLLTAWTRIVYTTIAFVGLSHFVKAYKLVNNPDYLNLFGNEWLQEQVRLAHAEFGYISGVGFFLFSIHLILLGFLIYKSTYIPKVFGILVALAGLGYMIDNLQPYLFPNVDTSLVMITFFGEIIFMFWLLIRGWKLKLNPNEGI